MTTEDKPWYLHEFDRRAQRWVDYLHHTLPDMPWNDLFHAAKHDYVAARKLWAMLRLQGHMLAEYNNYCRRLGWPREPDHD